MPAESPRQEADGSTDASDKVFSCPTCDRTFDTKNGRSVHHYQAHGETIAKATKICAWCDNEFEYYKHNSTKKYCSDDCRAKSVSKQMSGSKNQNWVKRVSVRCEQCGKQFNAKKNQADARKYCSRSCRQKHVKENWNGVNHPRWVENTESFECKYCGEVYEKHESLEDRTSYCSKKCHAKAQSEKRRGKSNHQWSGGYGSYYGPNWPSQSKKALRRDQYRCQRCLSSENDLGRKPDVHHLKRIEWYKDNYESPKWYKEANQLDNLVCLCRSCHGKWEGIPLRPQ